MEDDTIMREHDQAALARLNSGGIKSRVTPCGAQPAAASAASLAAIVMPPPTTADTFTECTPTGEAWHLASYSCDSSAGVTCWQPGPFSFESRAASLPAALSPSARAIFADVVARAPVFSSPSCSPACPPAEWISQATFLHHDVMRRDVLMPPVTHPWHHPGRYGTDGRAQSPAWSPAPFASDGTLPWRPRTPSLTPSGSIDSLVEAIKSQSEVPVIGDLTPPDLCHYILTSDSDDDSTDTRPLNHEPIDSRSPAESPVIAPPTAQACAYAGRVNPDRDVKNAHVKSPPSPAAQPPQALSPPILSPIKPPAPRQHKRKSLQLPIAAPSTRSSEVAMVALTSSLTPVASVKKKSAPLLAAAPVASRAKNAESTAPLPAATESAAASSLPSIAASPSTRQPKKKQKVAAASVGAAPSASIKQVAEAVPSSVLLCAASTSETGVCIKLRRVSVTSLPALPETKSSFSSSAAQVMSIASAPQFKESASLPRQSLPPLPQLGTRIIGTDIHLSAEDKLAKAIPRPESKSPQKRKNLLTVGGASLTLPLKSEPCVLDALPVAVVPARTKKPTKKVGATEMARSSEWLAALGTCNQDRHLLCATVKVVQQALAGKLKSLMHYWKQEGIALPASWTHGYTVPRQDNWRPQPPMAPARSGSSTPSVGTVDVELSGPPPRWEEAKAELLSSPTQAEEQEARSHLILLAPSATYAHQATTVPSLATPIQAPMVAVESPPTSESSVLVPVSPLPAQIVPAEHSELAWPEVTKEVVMAEDDSGEDCASVHVDTVDDEVASVGTEPPVDTDADAIMEDANLPAPSLICCS